MTEVSASVIILTMCDRAGPLQKAIDSVRRQSQVCDVVIVCNGCDIGEIEGAHVVALPVNLGIPGGRNVGVAESDADIVLFLDDDGAYADEHLVREVLQRFAADQRLGIISFRIDDEDGTGGERRHVPRLRASDPHRSSDVTTFLGGACAIRRDLFDEVGPLPDNFFYGHEETDFAWRALDAGYRIAYRGDLGIIHPAGPAHRHDEYFYQSARNRVWLARRRLPWSIGVVYLAVWLGLSLLRPGQHQGWGMTMRGVRAGLTEPAGERAPIKWATVLHMARLGRPPII